MTPRSSLTSLLVFSDSFFMREIFDKVFSHEEKFITKIVKNSQDLETSLSNDRFHMVLLECNNKQIVTINKLIQVSVKNYALPTILIVADSEIETKITVPLQYRNRIQILKRPVSPYEILDFDLFRAKLITTIKETMVKQRSRSGVHQKSSYPANLPAYAIVIGSSTGGIEPLRYLVSHIPKTMISTIFIVQHLPVAFMQTFINRLNKISKLSIKQIENGDMIVPGQIFVVPPDVRFILQKEVTESSAGKIKAKIEVQLHTSNKLSSVDEVMTNVTAIFKDRTIGIILSGMGDDGVNGARKIKENEGVVLVQDLDSAILDGMPGEVIRAQLADEILPIERISHYINTLK